MPKIDIHSVPLLKEGKLFSITYVEGAISQISTCSDDFRKDHFRVTIGGECIIVNPSDYREFNMGPGKHIRGFCVVTWIYDWIEPVHCYNFYSPNS